MSMRGGRQSFRISADPVGLPTYPWIDNNSRARDQQVQTRLEGPKRSPSCKSRPCFPNMVSTGDGFVQPPKSVDV